MPKLNAAKMEDRRRHIAMAAHRCFQREGFAAASVDSICAEAGISKGAFYVHFKGKEAVIHAVAELRSEAIGPIPGDTPTAIADAVTDTLIAELLAPTAARYEVEAMMTSVDDAVQNARAVANLEAIGERLREAIARVAPADAPLLAAMVETYCLGLILKAAVWTPDRLDDVRAAMRRLLAG